MIIRDLAFNKKRSYGELLSSAEGIATNILAKRLLKLSDAGLLHKNRSGVNKKVFYYGLTDKGKALIPTLVELILWGATYGPKNKALLSWAAQIKKDKPAMIAQTLESLSEIQ